MVSASSSSLQNALGPSGSGNGQVILSGAGGEAGGAEERGESLALSDIMHTNGMSPSPVSAHQVPKHDALVGEASQDTEMFDSSLIMTPKASRRKETSALSSQAANPEERGEGDGEADESEFEPATEEDVSRIRQRLVELGLSVDGRTKSGSCSGGLSRREEELLDMVLKFTRAPAISSTQLLAQAEMIENMQTQRMRMAKDIEDERLMWDAQRYGWERMAEVLIAQRSRACAPGGKDDDLERRCGLYRAENEILKDRLQSANDRTAALEAEVAKLKPLLLMVPPSHSIAKGKRRRHAGANINEEPEARDAPPPTAPVQPPEPPHAFPVEGRTILTVRAALAAAGAAATAAAAASSSTGPPPADTTATAMIQTPSAASTSAGVAPAAPGSPSKGDAPLVYRYPYPCFPGAPPGLATTPTATGEGAQVSAAKNTNPYLSYAISTRLSGGQPQHIAPLPSSSPSTAPPPFTTASTPSYNQHTRTKSHTQPNAHASTSRVLRIPTASSFQGKDNQKQEVKPRKASSGTLSYDARTEHLLLAARKIGRERATAMSTYAREAEKEKERYVKEREAAREREREAQKGKEREAGEGGKEGKGKSKSAYYRSIGSANAAGGDETLDAATRSEEKERALQRIVEEHEEYQRQQRLWKAPQWVYVKTPGSSNNAASGSMPGGRIIARAEDLNEQGQGGGARIVGQVQDQQGQSASSGSGSSGTTQGVVRVVGMPSAGPSTPHRAHAAAQQQQHSQSQLQAQPGSGIPTPGLESLLSAARSMMSNDEAEEREREERESSVLPVPVVGRTPRARKLSSVAAGGNAGPVNVGRRRGAAAMDEGESPVPAKRRRTGALSASVAVASSSVPNGNPGTRRSGLKAGRVPSALDVLADQAQVAAAHASMPYGETSTSRVSNARAEVGKRVDVGTSGEGGVKKKNARGKAAATKGAKAKADEKGKGKAVVEVDDDGEPEVEEGAKTHRRQAEQEHESPQELAPVVQAPENRPERRKRGRPRKDQQQSASAVGVSSGSIPAPPPTPAVDGDIKEDEVSARISARGRRQVAPKQKGHTAGRSTSTSAGRQRLGSETKTGQQSMSVSSAREPLSGGGRRGGRGGANGKGSAVSPERVVGAVSALDDSPSRLLSPMDVHPSSPLPLVNADEGHAQGVEDLSSAVAELSNAPMTCPTPPNAQDVLMGEANDTTAPPAPPATITPRNESDSDPPSIPLPSALDGVSLPFKPPSPSRLGVSTSKGLPTPPRDTHGDAEHDSELDADAEADPDIDIDVDAEAEVDEDLDAEGEDEDEREVVESMHSEWAHAPFGVPGISTPMHKAQAGAVDDDEMDAEGEVENELEESSAAMFNSS